MRRFLPLAALVLLAGCSQPPEGDPSPTGKVASVPNTYAPDALDGKVDKPSGTKITPAPDPATASR
ncbi:hypothetical protein BH11ARM2_BH11ARM2_31190 [soil metagenome]